MISKFNPQKTKSLEKINRILEVFFHEKKIIDPINMEKVKKILIIDPTLIGDIVMLIPFLRIIKNSTQEAELTLVCGSWAEQILGEQGLVDRFIFIDSNLLNSPREMLFKWHLVKTVIKEINKSYYDVAIEPRGDLRYIFFMHFCNADRKLSYNYTGGECLLTDVIQPSDLVTHLVEDKLYLAWKLGCRISELDKYPRLLLTESQKKQNELFIKENALTDEIIIGMHPGASLRIKQWDGFGRLLEQLNCLRKDIVFMLFEGPGEGKIVENIVSVARQCEARYIVSRTTIREYMQRISMCNAVVCNDSGAGHIAAAYGVPVYVVFGPTLPELARPYAKENVYVFSDNTVPCKPCLAAICKKGTNACIRYIDETKMINMILKSIET